MHPYRSRNVWLSNFTTIRIRCELRTDSPRIPVDAAQKTVDYRAEVFLHQSKQYMSYNRNNNKKYYVFMKIRLLIGRHIRIGRRLHVNQPLRLCETS